MLWRTGCRRLPTSSNQRTYNPLSNKTRYARLEEFLILIRGYHLSITNINIVYSIH